MNIFQELLENPQNELMEQAVARRTHTHRVFLLFCTGSLFDGGQTFPDAPWAPFTATPRSRPSWISAGRM